MLTTYLQPSCPRAKGFPASNTHQHVTGLQLLHRLLQLLQGSAGWPASSPAVNPAVLRLPLLLLAGPALLLTPAGPPMQAAQNLPPHPSHWPPAAFAAPHPSQQGGLFHDLLG